MIYRNAQKYNYWRCGFLKGLQLCEDKIPTHLFVQRAFECERHGTYTSGLEAPCSRHQYCLDVMCSLAREIKATDVTIKNKGRFKTIQRYSLDKDYCEYKSSPHVSPILHLCVCFSRKMPGMIRYVPEFLHHINPALRSNRRLSRFSLQLKEGVFHYAPRLEDLHCYVETKPSLPKNCSELLQGVPKLAEDYLQHDVQITEVWHEHLGEQLEISCVIDDDEHYNTLC